MTQNHDASLGTSPLPSWTPETRAEFLATLARCGTVLDALKKVDLSPQSAYQLRARDPSFAKAWEFAREQARDCVTEELYALALDGWKEDVWYRGELVGQRVRRDPRLLLRILERLDRNYGHDRDSAMDDANRFGEILAAEEQGESTDHLFEKPLWQLQDDYDDAMQFGSYGRADNLRERMDAIKEPEAEPIITCEDPACIACRAADGAVEGIMIDVNIEGAPIGCITVAREAEEAANDPEWQAAVAEMEALREALHGKTTTKVFPPKSRKRPGSQGVYR